MADMTVLIVCADRCVHQFAPALNEGKELSGAKILTN